MEIRDSDMCRLTAANMLMNCFNEYMRVGNGAKSLDDSRPPLEPYQAFLRVKDFVAANPERRFVWKARIINRCSTRNSIEAHDIEKKR